MVLPTPLQAFSGMPKASATTEKQTIVDGEKMTGAEALVRSLEDLGIKDVFGVPGGAILPVYDSIKDDTKFRFVLMRHEQAAGHAAEGYALTTGQVGVCIVTSGPGATNMITPIADANMDSIPMVVITGQVGVNAIGTDAFQEADIVGATYPVVKHSYLVTRAQDIPRVLAEAHYIARSGRPGPVVVDVTKTAQTGEMYYSWPQRMILPGYNPTTKAHGRVLSDAAKLFEQSYRPVLYVGGGAVRSDAGELVEELAEVTGAPIVTTLPARGIVPDSDPKVLGMLGMHGNYAPNIKQQECDVLIAIGMRFSDRVTGRLDKYAKQAKVIHLDIDPAEIDKNVKTDVAVIGDCKESLSRINKLVKKNEHKKWIESFKPLYEEEKREVIDPSVHPKDGELLMGEVINAVAEATNGEAVMCNDVGLHQMFSCRYFKYKKDRSVVSSGGFGTMGFGLPAAIGATFGAPDRQVVLFTGDGSFQMCIEELGTIMEQQAPVKIILLNNHYLGNVRQWQDLMFNHRRSFTYMLNPHYQLIAQGYGINYDVVTNRDELKAKVEKMVSTDGPYILECAVKEDENVRPMVTPGSSVDEMQLHLDI